MNTAVSRVLKYDKQQHSDSVDWWHEDRNELMLSPYKPTMLE